MIFVATIVGSFCAEQANVEVSTALPVAPVAESEQQKRSIVSDCDGPIIGGAIGGLHSDVAVHSDLALGVHGHGYASGYAPGYSSGYSGGYLGSGGVVGLSGLGGYGQVAALGHVGGSVLASSHSSHGYALSHGYASAAPVLASSVYSTPVVSHAPVIAAPAVCYTVLFFPQIKQLRKLNFQNKLFLSTIEHCYSNTNKDNNSTSARATASSSAR